MFRAVEYYAHHSLTSAHRTVSLDMDLIDADCLTLCDEGIEHILAEVFTFNDYFLLVGVTIWVVSRESVDTVRLLADSRCDGPWIESKHASTSNDTDLRSFWHQNSQA